MALPPSGWASQPNTAPITAVPLPVPHVATYRDGGAAVQSAGADLVVRSAGNAVATIAGARSEDREPVVAVAFEVRDAYAVILVDRTELEGAGFSPCGVRPGSIFNPCQPRPHG
jgi:hypothetical protein